MTSRAKPGRTTAAVWGALVAAVLAIPVEMALGARVPNTVDVPVTPRNAAWEVVPVDLGARPAPGHTSSVRTSLSLGRPESLTVHEELRLAVTTYDTPSTLQVAAIRVLGTGCVYRTDPGTRLVNNSYLRFRRLPDCASAAGVVPSGELDLEMTFDGEARIGLLTYSVPAEDIDPRWITFAELAAEPAVDSSAEPAAVVPAIVARYTDTFGQSPITRARLLAYTWQLSRRATWIWWLLGAAALLVATGVVLLRPAAAGDHGGESRAPAIQAASGAGAIALGLGLLYSVLVPALQAADEPDHFLTFAEVAGRPALVSGTEDLARIGHFDRIRFHNDEQFRPVDIGQPATTTWGPEVFAHKVAERSVTTAFWWRLLAPLLGNAGAPGALLGIRLANALVFGVAVWISAFLLCRVSGAVSDAPHVAVLALLVVPTLPFFATYVSEFALLASSFVLVTAVAVGLVLGGRRGHLLGLPLGLSVSLVLASGRSAMPFMAMLGAIIIGCALLRSRRPDRTRESRTNPSAASRRRAMIFWGGLGGGLLVFPLLSTPEFRAGLWPADTTKLPDWFRLGAEALRQQPWVILLLAPLGFAIDRGLSWVRRTTRGLRSFPASWLRAITLTGALTLAVSLLASLVVRYPTMVNSEAMRPAFVGGYVGDVLRVAGTGFRLNNHDYYLSTSLWAGFGWIDTIPGEWFVTVVVVLMAAALAGLLVHIGRAGLTRQAIWVALLAVGGVASLAAYAAASYFVNRSLHGRYLLGLYLVGCGVAWSVMAMLPRWPDSGWWHRLGLCRERAIVLLAAGIHGYALSFILRRYF